MEIGTVVSWMIIVAVLLKLSHSIFITIKYVIYGAPERVVARVDRFARITEPDEPVIQKPKKTEWTAEQKEEWRQNKLKEEKEKKINALKAKNKTTTIVLAKAEANKNDPQLTLF